MTEDIQAFLCPSCGAPIHFEEEENLATCGHCGVQVKRQPDPVPEYNQPHITIDLEKYATMAQAPARNSIGIAIAVIFFIALFTGIMIFAITATEQSFGSPDIQGSQVINSNQVYSISGAQILSSDGPEIIVVAYVIDSTYRYIYLDFGAEVIERWRSAPLPDEYYRAVTLTDDQNIYVALKTEFYAISRADGAELWRVKLSDEISVSCDACLLRTGDKVVVLPQDGVVAAYNIADGSRSWGVSLEEPARALFLLDGKPAVWDKVEDGAAVRVFDLTTGQDALRIAPSGPNEPFPSDPQTPNIYSPLLVDPDGKSFYTLFGTFEPLTIQRWDAQNGTMLWQVEALQDYSRGTSMPVLSGGYLIIYSDGNMMALETATGAQKLMEPVEDYELTPLAVHEGKLLASAYRQRGSARDELWAYDLETGQIAWKVLPEAKRRMADDFGFVDSDGEWMIHPVPGGIWLIQFINDPVGMKYQRLDLTSGTGDAPKTILPPGSTADTTTLYLNPFYWQGENLWYAGDKLYLINLESGETTVKWP
ncbi:MAG TPA: PQQ-binding-like beta-propeller repeat protein [Anaerolineaceae bacterium]|nr:PQQ-binding-like beta-propeller repeat protein [Anaerolineaceae bacterium]